MRILMLNNEFPPFGGGTATANLAVLLELKRRSDLNLEVDLITSSGDASSGIEEFSPTIRLIKVPVRVASLHHATGLNLMSYAVHAFRKARAMHQTRPYDLAFAWCTVPAGGVAWALHRLAGLPYIVRISGPDIPGYEARYRYLYPFLRPILRAIWRRAKRIIVKSAHESSLMRAASAQDTDKLVTVPNGVAERFFSIASGRTIQTKLRILSVGRLIAHKRHDLLVRAAADLRERGCAFSISIVGTGDEELSLKRLIHELGLATDVHLVGAVSREEIDAYYRDADVFALTSENEGMSVAMLEALASALPVIAVSGAGSDEFVAANQCGTLISEAAPTLLADALQRYANNRDLLSQHATQAQLTARRYSWGSTTEALLKTLS